MQQVERGADPDDVRVTDPTGLAGGAHPPEVGHHRADPLAAAVHQRLEQGRQVVLAEDVGGLVQRCELGGPEVVQVRELLAELLVYQL